MFEMSVSLVAPLIAMRERAGLLKVDVASGLWRTFRRGLAIKSGRKRRRATSPLLLRRARNRATYLTANVAMAEASRFLP
jgi:hypothetical protein